MPWYDQTYPLNINPFKNAAVGVSDYIGQFKGNDPKTWFGGMSGQAVNTLDARNNLINQKANELGFNNQGTIQNTGQVNKMSMIPDNFIENMKRLYGGITNTDAAKTMNTGNKYANLADDAWANKQTIRTPGGEIVVDTESGQVAPDIASFPGDEIQETETEQFPLDTNWQEILNRNNEEEQYGITGPNKWQQFLSKVTHQPYRGAQRHTRDFTPAQLNKMNALGGWYSDPARQQRRDRRSVSTLLARKAAAEAGRGTWTTASQKNLNLKTMGSRPGHYDMPGGNGGVQGTSSPAESGGWHPGVAQGGYMRSQYNKGGRVGILSVF